MLFDSFQYMTYQPGDEKINIDSLIALDPLVAIDEQTNTSFRTYAYPNPFQNRIQIGYVLEKPSRIGIEIYSILGVLITHIDLGEETAGQHEITWDAKSSTGSGLANGTYLYILKTETELGYGKLNLFSRTN